MLDRILKYTLAAILFTMTLVVGANVFCRFVLNFSIYWADEVAQILLVWLTFLGAALSVKEKSHYAMNFLSERIKGRARKYFIWAGDIFNLIAVLTLLYFSLVVTWHIIPWVMPATEISRAFVYGACPLGCLMMLYYTVQHLVRTKNN